MPVLAPALVETAEQQALLELVVMVPQAVM
jgi:hypothetical protein